MMPEQEDLLKEARDSLSAAKLLHEKGFYGFAASRAYYTMFYIAEAFLLGKGLAFSKHSGVHAGFGEHFVKTGMVPPEFQKYLVRGMEARMIGDYRVKEKVNREKSAEQIGHAEQFLEIAEKLIGPIPENEGA